MIPDEIKDNADFQKIANELKLYQKKMHELMSELYEKFPPGDNAYWKQHETTGELAIYSTTPPSWEW